MKLSIALILISVSVSAQVVDVEYDKNRDFSIYQSFRFGESEIIIPNRVDAQNDSSFHALMENIVGKEIKNKGLKHQPINADLVVTYLITSQEKLQLERIGSSGITPTNRKQLWERNYNLSSIVIDLNTQKGDLVWRINANAQNTNISLESILEQLIARGFKKFSIKKKKRR